LLLVLFAFACPSLTGCLGGYVYPTLSVVPPAASAPVTEDVRAFRVDVQTTDGSLEFPGGHRYELAELSSLERHLPQVKVGLDRGWFLFCVALNYGQHTHSTVKVRLYRPGYETLELESWEVGGRPDWKSAEGAAAQEAAVDALVTTWATTPLNLSMPPEEAGDGKGPRKDAYLFSGLAPGSAGRAHWEALLFAAGEYDRVRGVPGATADVTERVAKKAAKLRELAEH
jgi:hypothetical protein